MVFFFRTRTIDNSNYLPRSRHRNKFKIVQNQQNFPNIFRVINRSTNILCGNGVSPWSHIFLAVHTAQQYVINISQVICIRLQLKPQPCNETVKSRNSFPSDFMCRLEKFLCTENKRVGF